MTTIEGVIDRTIDNLRAEIQRNVIYRVYCLNKYYFNHTFFFKKFEPDEIIKLSQFVVKLEDLKNLDTKFRVIINDPSGDSFIQNPNSPYKDENCHVTYYKRNKEQNEFVGIQVINQFIFS
jgi:C4-type Zn-finger protein